MTTIWDRKGRNRRRSDLWIIYAMRRSKQKKRIIVSSMDV